MKKKSRENIVAISGMYGFIGSRCYEILTELGYIVYPIPRIVLSDAKSAIKAIKSINPSYVIHLSAYGNHYNQKDDIETINANIFKTIYLVTASCELPLKAFINVSTSSVYAKTADLMNEKGRTDPKSMYAKTKLAGEIICQGYAENRKVPLVNIRPFSIYGPKEAEHRMIPTMFNSLQKDPKDKKARMILDPKPVHDWTYVDDFVHGLVCTMKNAKELAGKTVNIGTGKQWTNEDIADKIEWITGKKVMYKEVAGLRENDVKNWKADISLIKSYGWTPKTDTMAGLREIAKYYAEK